MEKYKKNYNTWEDDEDDDLPRIISSAEFLANPPILPEEVIQGVVRQGHKMMISGASKSGKSFLLIELAIALAEGTKWLGFQCRPSRVLYINLEIDPNSLLNRFYVIYEALGIKPRHFRDIVIWNLRGEAQPLDQLAPDLIRRASNLGVDVIILDPIYKVMMGDENNATDMAQFTNVFDKICYETGCTFVYSHHHSKGAQGFKRSMDRASGSGVFARDADAQVDMIQLNLVEVPMQNDDEDSTATAWRLESSLREFQSFKPVNIWFEYPIHIVENSDKLDKNYADGDPRVNLLRSYKRNQTTDSRKEEFDRVFDLNKMKDGTCFASVLSECLGIAERTVRDRVKEFSDEYATKKRNRFKEEVNLEYREKCSFRHKFQFWQKGKNHLYSNCQKNWRIGLIYMCCNNTLTHVCRIGLESLPYSKQCIIVSTRLSTHPKKKKKEESRKQLQRIVTISKIIVVFYTPPFINYGEAWVPSSWAINLRGTIFLKF